MMAVLTPNCKVEMWKEFASKEIGIYLVLKKKKIQSQALLSHALILATQEAEIRRIEVQSQQRQKVCQILS
jgi:hypothetical protein